MENSSWRVLDSGEGNVKSWSRRLSQVMSLP